MWFICAVISLVTFGLSSFLMKYNSFKNWDLYYHLFGIYLSGSICFFILWINVGEMEFSLLTLIFGVLIGIGSAYGNLMFMKALDFGPASLTSPLVNISVILIVMMSIFIYGESIGILECVGVLLVIVATSLLPFDPNETFSIQNKKWYLFILLATLLFFLRNGGLKITDELNLNNTSILFFGYLLGAIGYGICLFTRNHKNSTKEIKRNALYSGVITGIFSFLGMQFYTLSLNLGPASIVSPLFASHSLIVVILSVFLLKEKLSKIQIIALIGIFVGIGLIRI